MQVNCQLSTRLCRCTTIEATQLTIPSQVIQLVRFVILAIVTEHPELL